MDCRIDLCENISQTPSEKTTFIDLFSGIGGFRLAGIRNGWECKMSSEIMVEPRESYKLNYNEYPMGDITKIDASNIPKFDVLCGGFPCQAFSQIGHQKGFDDIRGTLFFEIARILKSKKPLAFFLENVPAIINHDNGKTFETVLNTLDALGYSCDHKIVRASDFGLPQSRPRVYMVGFRKDAVKNHKFVFPDKTSLKLTMSDVFEGQCNRDIGFTVRCGGRRSGIQSRHNWDAYIVDNEVRYLTPKEARCMMGYPDDYKLFGSEIVQMRQLGNSVAVPAVEAVMNKIEQIIVLNKCIGSGTTAIYRG